MNKNQLKLIKKECMKFASNEMLLIREMDGDRFIASDAEGEVNVAYIDIYTNVKAGYTIESVLQQALSFTGDHL